MSTAITAQPWEANWAARGRPILPAPMTATVPAVPVSPVHGRTRRAGSWRQALAGTVIEPPSSEAVETAVTIGLTGHQLHGSAFARCGQERVGEDDSPAPVGRIHDRPATVAHDVDERLELGDERLTRRDAELDDVAFESGCIAPDEPRRRGVRRAGEGQALGQVVELEHALLAEHRQLATLGRREPVDVEHGDGARRERHQAEQEVLVVGVDAARGLRRDA